MSNLRIVANNLAASATITASSAVGALVATNLRTEDKASPWRTAAGTWAQINAAWPASVLVSCAALVNCNLSPTALVRVRTTNEQPATNLWTNSNAVSTLSSVGVVKTDGFTTAPDGYFNGGLLRLDSTTGSHYAERLFTGTYATADTYTTSMFVKAVGVSVISLWHFYAAGGAGGIYAVFNLATGTVTAKSSQAATIMGYGNGWFRISITTPLANAVAEPTRLLSRLILSGVGTAFTGDGVAGLYVYGMQMEKGNLSSYYPAGGSAATRPLGYIDYWQLYDYDTSAVFACPAPARKLRGWTPAQAASAYAYGGGATAVVWIPPIQAVGVSIIISDPNNLQGYIEAANLVIGEYWSPKYNVSAASVASVESSAHFRTAAGSLKTEVGTIHRRVSFELPDMVPVDRAVMDEILSSSQAYPILLSVYPNSADATLERDHTVYGKRKQDSEIAYAYVNAYSTQVEVESI